VPSFITRTKLFAIKIEQQLKKGNYINMIIVGAGGLATQLIEDLVQLKMPNIVFWSETETKYPFIRDLYPIIKTDNEIIEHFDTVSREFILCVGTSGNGARKILSKRFKQLGGTIASYLSPFSRISPYGTSFGLGTIILNQVNVEPGVDMGVECIINKTANIGHGCKLGNSVEVCPGVIMTGDVSVGDDTFIGTGAIIHPKIDIGKNVMVSAGAVVTRNLPDNAVVSGVPAQIKFLKKDAG
jgi:sugar O-acyltransferase (sialic acid O-acetyltransferase NeuD family)